MKLSLFEGKIRFMNTRLFELGNFTNFQVAAFSSIDTVLHILIKGKPYTVYQNNPTMGDIIKAIY